MCLQHEQYYINILHYKPALDSGKHRDFYQNNQKNWISKDLEGKVHVTQCDASHETNKTFPYPGNQRLTMSFLFTGTLVVNLGDCLQAWTKGLYRATKHRVRRSVKTDRYSIPLFFNPNRGCIIEPVETCVTRNLSFTKVVKGQQLPFTFGDFSKKLLEKSHDWKKGHNNTD